MTEIQHAGLNKSVSCSSLQPLQAWHNLMLSTDEIIDLQSAKRPGCFAHISSPHWLKKKEREREWNSSAASAGSDCEASRARQHVCPTDGSQRAAHHVCFQVQSKDPLLQKPEDTDPLSYVFNMEPLPLNRCLLWVLIIYLFLNCHHQFASF